MIKPATITIKNNGNLALKYMVIITGINGDAILNNAIEWTIKLAGNDYALNSEHKLNSQESDTLTISGHMKEDAGNEYQGLSIDGISITVLATQVTEEYDSNGNTYDASASYPIIVSAPVSVAANNTVADDVVLKSTETISVNDDTPLASSTVSAGTKVEGGASLLVLKVTRCATPSNIRIDANNSSQAYDIKVDGIAADNTERIKVELYVGSGLGELSVWHNETRMDSSDFTYDTATGIAADNSGAFVGNAHTTTQNAGNGGSLILDDLTLTGSVTIEGENVGGIMGSEWTDFQINATNITVDVSNGSYVKGSGKIGGVFASTPHGHLNNIKSNMPVVASGAQVVAGGIVGCAGWDMGDTEDGEIGYIICTGNVVATGVEVTENGKYSIGKIVGQEANNSYWGYYKKADYGSFFKNFTANNTIEITLANGTVLTSNGMTAEDRHGAANTVDYTQSLVGTAIWDWMF